MDSFTASIPSLQQCDVGQPLTCLSFSPHLQQAAAGGRDIRIFAVASTDLTLQPRAVLSSGSLGQSTSVSDLSFHPSPHPALSSSLLAASTSGHISLYSLSASTGLRRPMRLFDHHTRTVNRVAWHAQQPDVFYSASQDGSVLWWDARMSGCAGGWDAEAGAVRDVQMDKGFAGVPLVAAAYEDGSVAVWDTRGGNGGGALKDQLLSISAHQGYTLTLDWHPTNTALLATGGKDRNVCVWDISAALASDHAGSTSPLHTIATSASVHRLAWRPHRPHQLASSASSSVDFDVQLWNVHTPHIPLAIAPHNRTAVSGLAFKESGDELLTATRGGVVSRLSVDDCYQPYERLSTTALDWNVRDELVSVEDAMTRTRGLVLARDAPAVFPVQYQWREREAEKTNATVQPPGLLRVHTVDTLSQGTDVLVAGVRGEGVMSDTAVFELCARRYRLQGGSVRDLSAHNAAVALLAHRPQLAHIWDVLALLYGAQSSGPDSDIHVAHAKATDTAKPQSAGFPSPPPSAPSSRATSRVSNHAATPRMSAALSPDGAVDEESVTSQYLAYVPPTPFPSAQPTPTSSTVHHTVLQASATKSTVQLSRHSILLDTLPVVHLSHVFHSNNALPHSRYPLFAAATTTAAPSQSSPTPRSSRASATATTARTAPLTSGSPAASTTAPRVRSPLELPSHLSALLLALLTQLVDAGDAQTCCSVLIVLAASAHSQPLLATLPAARLRHFFFHYVDRLHRLRLFTEATAVHQLTPPHLLSPSNQHHTGVGLMCGECGRGSEAGDEGCYCSSCGSGMSACSVCELLVRGLYVWCQGCGHGGHADHMADWFSTSRVCPTGCMHRCVDELASFPTGIVT